MAKSTHADPWLRFIRHRLGDGVHFWPFDGWEIPAGHSAVAEIYPALMRRSFVREGAQTISMMPTASRPSFRAPTGAAARGVPETRPDATRTHASVRRAGYWEWRN